MFRLSYIIFFLFLWSLTCSGQISGHGYLDGVYRFDLILRESNDGFKEGTIRYNGETQGNQLIATTHKDTLHCQEIDDFLNPISTLLLIKKDGIYQGEWYDDKNRAILPAVLYLSKDMTPPQLYAKRFQFNDNIENNKKMIEVPLSPTISIGKYIHAGKKEITAYSSNTSFGTTTIYEKKGIIDLDNEEEIAEKISIENYFLQETNFSIEAMIPTFSQAFVDSLHAALVQWKASLAQQSIPASRQRFPNRYYAICDIDFWVDDFVCGSFEYVSPSGSGKGFTFIFDRKADEFIAFEKLIRSGELSAKLQNNKIGLGISFNIYGMIDKGSFRSISGRSNEFYKWNDLDLRLKRKLNDYLR